MLKEKYGAVLFPLAVNVNVIGTKQAFQVIANEQRWDVSELHVDVSQLGNGSLTIGYGPLANNPVIFQTNEICNRDILLPETGIGNPNQLPLNAYVAADLCVAQINAGAHIVKGSDKVWLNPVLNGAAPFSKRYGATMVSFDPGDGQGIRLYYMGGYDGINYYNDVWSSFDGVTWTAIAVSPFTARSQHCTVVLGTKMYVLMGNNGAAMNDVWSSSDGITWTEILPARMPLARYDFGATSINGVIYFAGGYTGAFYLNDVWSSPDGINWTSLGNAPWVARSGLNMIPWNNKLYVAGGYDGAIYYNDVWISNGQAQVTSGQYPSHTSSWVKLTQQNNYAARAYHNLQTLQKNRQSEVLVFNGVNASGYPADAWGSKDACFWNYNNPALAIGNRKYMASCVMNGLVYAVGGFDGATYYNDVWRTNQINV